MKNLTFDTLLRWAVWLVLLSLVVLLLYRFSTLLAYALIALVFSYLLDPFVNRLQSAGMNRTLSISVVLASLILVVVWLSTNFLPAIANQLVGLFQQLSGENLRIIAAQVEEELITLVPMLPEGFLLQEVYPAIEELLQVEDVQDTLTGIFGLFADLAWAILVIPFATFFFLKDGSRIRRQLLQIIPNPYFESVLGLISKVETRLGHYFKSVGLQCFLVAMSAWLFLSLAGLNNAMAVGITVGVANVIPYFGPILGYILSIIVAVFETGDFSLVLICLLAIMLTQILDNIFFQPLIFSRSADLHPLIVLFVIMIGAEVGGIFGMIIAVPVTATIKITINQVIWSFNNYQVFRIRG